MEPNGAQMEPKWSPMEHFGVTLAVLGPPWGPLWSTLASFGSLLGYLEFHMEVWGVIWRPFNVFVDNGGKLRGDIVRHSGKL